MTTVSSTVTILFVEGSSFAAHEGATSHNVETSDKKTSSRKNQRRIRRGSAASTTAASESLLTGELPPLSPEQIEAYEIYEEDNEEAGRLLSKNKKGASKKRLFFGKKGPKHFKKHGYGGGLFGPGFGGKKFFKKHKKGHYGGGLFNNGYAYGGPAAAYGPNMYGAGYNRPGVGLGAILGPIIGIAIVACIAAKFCCLW